jgi:hypothetical protein
MTQSSIEVAVEMRNLSHPRNTQKTASKVSQSQICKPIDNWSGKNSVFARQKAAVRLEDILSKRGDQLTLVVAHSHGGNVALNAISKLNDPTNVYLCTMATPFLSIFEVNRLRRHSGSLFYIVGALTTWNILHSLSVYSLLDSIISIPFGALLLWWWLFVKGIKSIYSILEVLLVNPAPPPGRNPTRWQKWPKLVADATPKDAKALNGRLLVLRGIDDEAALTLAAGAIINRISRAIYNVSACSLFGWGGWAVFLPILIVTKGLEHFAPAYNGWGCGPVERTSRLERSGAPTDVTPVDVP